MLAITKRLQNNDWDSLFDPFYTSPFSSKALSWRDVDSMRVDAYRKDNTTFIEADLPGFAKDDIDISVNEGVLTITAEKKEDTKSKDNQYIVSERKYKRLTRSFSLPEDINVEEVTASCKDGVLSVNLPHIHKEEKKAKKIEVLNS